MWHSIHTRKILSRDRELLIPLLPLKTNQYCKTMVINWKWLRRKTRMPTG